MPAVGKDGSWRQEWMGDTLWPPQGPAEFVEAVPMGLRSDRTTVQDLGAPDQGDKRMRSRTPADPQMGCYTEKAALGRDFPG